MKALTHLTLGLGSAFALLGAIIVAAYYWLTSRAHQALQSFGDVHRALSAQNASCESTRNIALDFLVANKSAWEAVDRVVEFAAATSVLAGIVFFYIFLRLRAMDTSRAHERH